MDDLLILISGKQGSGKTSTADKILELAGKNGYRPERITLARPLKKLESIIWTFMESYGYQRPEKDGLLLQLLGTEWGRKTFGPDIWITLAKKTISALVASKYYDSSKPPQPLCLVIDDARFENEFDAFPEALRVRLDCPAEIRKARAVGWRDNTEHASETGLDSYVGQGKFDIVLYTNGDSSVEAIAKTILTAARTSERAKVLARAREAMG